MRQSSYCEFKFILFPLRHHLCVQKFERCSSAARPRCSIWIAWLPFLYNIAKFLLQLSLPMWMGTPTSLNRILWQVLYHYAGDWWECLWFCWPLVVCRLREEASKHTLCWGVLRVCAVWFIVGWVHALWISAKQTSWWALGIFLVWVNVGSGLCCPVVVCMFCEEAFKQTSLCWGVLGSLWWVNVGSVCWGLWWPLVACVLSEKAFKQNPLCWGVLQAFAGLRSRYMNKYQHTPYSGGQSSFSACLVRSFFSDVLTHLLLLKKERKVLQGAKLFCVLVIGRMPLVRTVWLSFPPSPLRFK